MPEDPRRHAPLEDYRKQCFKEAMHDLAKAKERLSSIGGVHEASFETLRDATVVLLKNEVQRSNKIPCRKIQ